MAKRIELNAEEMDQVVGGAFNYFEDSDGAYKCLVDDVGLYYAKYSAKRQITILYLNNKDKSPAELVQMAIDAGELSETPFA